MADAFHKFASKSAEVVGSAKSFLAALLLIVVWSMAGPYLAGPMGTSSSSTPRPQWSPS